MTKRPVLTILFIIIFFFTGACLLKLSLSMPAGFIASSRYGEPVENWQIIMVGIASITMALYGAFTLIRGAKKKKKRKPSRRG
jgi:predicted permease